MADTTSVTVGDAVRRDRYATGILSHDRTTERRRLGLLERDRDPHTIAALEALEPQETWRCLEVGAGNGSIARWLCTRCPRGAVVAIDSDTRYLSTEWAPNLEVRRQDIVTEEFADEPFDLVHARWLLANLPEREQILERLARLLAPGGWLVVEDPDIAMIDSSPHPMFQRLVLAQEKLLRDSHGEDMRWARRRLPAALHELGLVDVRMSISMIYVGDGGAGDDWARLSNAQWKQDFVDSGLLTAEEFEAAMAQFDDPAFIDIMRLTVSAVGRRPAG